MVENQKETDIRIRRLLRWLDLLWRMATSRWAVAALLLGWILMLAICAWVPQQGAATAVDRWAAALQGRRRLIGDVVAGLALTRVWQGWAVRSLQGLSAGWLILRWLGDLFGWLGAEERASREWRLDLAWEAARRDAERVAGSEGWRVAEAGDDTMVIWATRPPCHWQRGLISLVWVACLIVACGAWGSLAGTQPALEASLALGDQALVRQWGIEDLRLDRMQFWPRADATARGLIVTVTVSSGPEEARQASVIAGRSARLDDALLRVMAVGPAIRVAAISPEGRQASLGPMAGPEGGQEAVRVQLGGLTQEHLIALDEGRAVLRLVERALAVNGQWDVLAELLDGSTGDLLARESLRAPDLLAGAGWRVELRPEYYVRLSLLPLPGPAQRAAMVAWLVGLALACIGLLARWRWRPGVASVTLSPVGQGARCVVLASSCWREDLIAAFGWDDALEETS